MSEGAHYRFPPSAAYRLNRCLYALKSDPDFAERFLADARAATEAMELSDEERAEWKKYCPRCNKPVQHKESK